jgi:hypothetical protein
MKVLQTLGRQSGTQAGIFQYKRSSTHVTIDGTVGQASQLAPSLVTLTTQEWSLILAAIEQAAQGSFRLSGSNLPAPPPPNQVLYSTISNAVPHPSGGWQWNDSWRAYVSAILEHEGSIDLYHGPLGRGQAPAFIPLSRDIP